MTGNRIVTYRYRHPALTDGYRETHDLMAAIAAAWAGGCRIGTGWAADCGARGESVWITPSLTAQPEPTEYVSVACPEHRELMAARAAIVTERRADACPDCDGGGIGCCASVVDSITR